MFDIFSMTDLNLVPMLLEYFLKVFIVLLVSLLAVWLMKSSSASTRHFVLFSAVILSLLIPLFSMVLPRHKIQIIPTEIMADSSISLISPEGSTSLNNVPVVEAQSMGQAQLPVISATDLKPGREPFPEIVIGISDVLLCFWLAGVSTFSGKLLISSVRVASLVRRAYPADERLKSILKETSRELGIDNPVCLKVSSDAVSPFTIGLFKHTIILPQEDISSSAGLRPVLLHELAHIKRSDNLTQRFAQTLSIIQWFNPLTWFVSRGMMKEREFACDNLVIEMGTQASSYACKLVTLARKMQHLRRSNWAAAAILNSNNFKERIMSILATNSNRKGVCGRMKFIIVIALAFLAIPLAIIQNTIFADSETTPNYKPEIENSGALVLDDVRVLETGKAVAIGFIPSHPNIVQIKGTFLNRTVYFKSHNEGFVGLFVFGHSTEPGNYKVKLELKDKDGNIFRNELEAPIIIKEKTEAPSPMDQQYSLKILESINPPKAAPPWPDSLLTPVEGKVTSPFGPRKNPITGKVEGHNGVDIAAKHGSPVRSALEGTVVLTENLEKYGNTVVVDHGGSMGTVYAHLDSWTVKKGDLVKKGDIIGKVGNSGVSTGPHLHWSLIIDDVALNPMNKASEGLFIKEKNTNLSR